MRLRLFAIVILCFSAISLNAQDVVYFRDSSTKSPSRSNKKRSSERNVVKIAPLSFLSGIVPVYFEREINDFFSIQAGAGITTRNYMREWTGSMEMNKPKVVKSSWNGSTTGENMNSLTDFENRTSSTGFHFSLQPRIYFESEGIDGMFIGFALDKSKYNFASRKVMTGPTTYDVIFTDEYFKEYDDFTDFNVHFGTQTLYDRISLEYSISVGLRSVKGTRYAFTYGDDGGIIDGSEDTKKTGPAFGLSFKLGYHF